MNRLDANIEYRKENGEVSFHLSSPIKEHSICQLMIGVEFVIDKNPDDIMEEAKRKAGQNPNTEVSVKLNDKETFKVTYISSKDTFECSRSAKVNS